MSNEVRFTYSKRVNCFHFCPIRKMTLLHIVFSSVELKAFLSSYNAHNAIHGGNVLFLNVQTRITRNRLYTY